MSELGHKSIKGIAKLATALLFVSFGCSAIELPEVFQKSPLIELPISVGRSSYDRVFITSSDYKGGGSVPLNEKYYSTMISLEKDLFEYPTEGFFSTKNKIFSYHNLFSKNGKTWDISRIPCDKNLKCFLLTPTHYSLLIVTKNNEITDFQLVRASSNSYGDDNFPKQKSQLDSMFGEVGWFPYPETDYENTGIFCSILTTKAADGSEKTQIFKRRITPEGKIENKALPEGVRECKLPW